MIDYYLIYDIEEIEKLKLPNFICCVKVEGGFRRIDNLEEYLNNLGGLSDEIIDPHRKGYFQVTKNWKKDLDKILERYDI